MNILQKISRQIIKKSFHFSVWTIERFHDMAIYSDQVEMLRQCPPGTLGHDIVLCLDQNKLKLVPNYESHDLKHVLLDFKMTPVDEIRMQAFMLGNGNYTLPCLAILIFGAILLPEKWPTFYRDFKRGQNSKPISNWTIQDFAYIQTLTLREQVLGTHYDRQSVFTMKKLIKFGALTSIITGVFGMIFCLPFLFSSNIADLVGAGFPFLGGAILTVGGLLALSNLAKQQLPKYA